MAHVDEHTLDLFVLNPSLLDERTRGALEGHIRECAGCRSMAEDLRLFYAELEKVADHGLASTPRREAFLASLVSRPGVIRLLPYRPRPSVAPSQGHEIVVLAAQSTATRGSSRFVTMATLASEGERLLLRIVLDGETDRFTAYLHAENPSRVKGALVTFANLPLNLVLDEKGEMEFTLDPEDRPPDWSAVETLVRSPLATLEIPRSAIASGRFSGPEGVGSGFDIRMAYAEGELSVAVAGATGAGSVPVCSVLLAGSAPGATILVELRDGAGKVPMGHLPEFLTMRLYP